MMSTKASKHWICSFSNLQVQHFPLHLQGEMERHLEIQAEEHVAGQWLVALSF